MEPPPAAVPRPRGSAGALGGQLPKATQPDGLVFHDLTNRKYSLTFIV